MIRKILFFLAFVICTEVIAQKPQRIGYIDMEYILENVPEYIEAQGRLSAKVATWQQRLDKIKREIGVMKTDLSNEKPLLTDELIGEREEDIQIREKELDRLQVAYFGSKGDLYLLRKQLVKPIQDQVYNAVQNIAVSKKYDIILDKSSDLIMLYSNKRFDVSELVLNSIVRGRKKAQLEEKKAKISADLESGNSAVDERAKNREALQARIKAQNEAKAKKREELRKAAAETRRKRLEEIENRKKNSVKSRQTPTDSTTVKSTDSLILPEATLSKDSIAKLKRAALLERLAKQKEAKAKIREDLKKAAEEKRKKRLEEIEKRKKAKEEQKKNNN